MSRSAHHTKTQKTFGFCAQNFSSVGSTKSGNFALSTAPSRKATVFLRSKNSYFDLACFFFKLSLLTFFHFFLKSYLFFSVIKLFLSLFFSVIFLIFIFKLALVQALLMIS